jgi:ABC-2 type transport system permease protein
MSARTPNLAGTGQLTWLALRRDRIMIPLWVLAIVALVLVTASSFSDLYPTVASRLPFARSVESNAGLIALTGPAFDLTSIGGLTAWRVAGTGGLLAGIMSLLLVVRHTRAEEESNRLELLSSGVVGRFAPLTAGLLAALTADLALAVLVALSLIGMGLPASGSIALGLGYGICGAVFAAAATVSAQLSESPRAANGIASAFLGAAYLFRAVGDSAGPGWLSWLSPIGWTQQVRPFAGERWWVLGLAVAVAGALGTLGYRLAGRRDLGEGVLPARPGPPRAAWWLRSSLALAWRLQRGSLIGWSIGLAFVGAVVGSLAQSVSSLVESSPQLGDALHSLGGKQDVVDAYLSTTLVFGGFAAAAYAVQAVLRLHGEETSQRAEPLLATETGRIRWALGHLAISFLGTAALLTSMGLAAGLAHGIRTGDLRGQLPRVLGASLVQVFAIWVFAGLVMALFGLAPKWSPAGWGFIVVALLISLIGALLKLNHWLLDLSPFTHLPVLPGGQMTWTPLLWLLVVTLGLSAVGLIALDRRDVG